jgi:hypothetical protein
MSKENVEIVRRFVESWERSDWDGMVDQVMQAESEPGSTKT